MTIDMCIVMYYTYYTYMQCLYDHLFDYLFQVINYFDQFVK